MSLAARSRVPKETIRHYVRRGLLPPAERAGRVAVYDRRHVDGLRLIRELRRRRRLPLETIRRLLPELLALGPRGTSPDAWDVALRRVSAPGATPDQLIGAAIELFSRRPYGSVTVLELSRAAGVGRDAFYRHFPSKEALLLAATRTSVAGALARFREDRRRSRSPASLTPRLADLLAPVLPLLTQTLAGAMQRRPGYAALLRRLHREAVEAATTHLGGRADIARDVVEGGAALAYRRALGLS